jgi:hypothetical protein
MIKTLLALVLATAMAGAVANPRAIWTWEEESYDMLEKEAAAADGIAFLKSKNISTVYLYADEFKGRNLIVARPAAYRALIKRMRQEGITVYALLGSGYLKTERYVLPKFRREAVNMVQRVLDYNKAATPEERFEGINLDIEPHILDEWDSQKMELLGHFLDMSDAIMKAKKRSGLTLQVGPAIPFWLDGITLAWRGKKRLVSEHTQDLYDYVALMDYRDRAGGGDGIISHAADELKYAESIGRKVMIGIETSPNEIQKVSFDHLREPDMERELALSHQAMAGSKAYGGFVLHHFRAYRAWLARGAKQ